MPVTNVEACISFIAANRLIADRFAAKAEQMLELVQTVEDIEQRIRIADLAQLSEKRADIHTTLAELQERDLGKKCHCPTQRTNVTKH